MGLATAGRAFLLSKLGGRRPVGFLPRANPQDLGTIRDLLESGKVTSVIDRTYSLSEVPEAVRYLEEGRARGKVVIGVH